MEEDRQMLEAVALAAKRALGERQFERIKESHTTLREAYGRLKEEQRLGAVYETGLGDCFVAGPGPWQRTGSMQVLPCGPGCATPLWATQVEVGEEGWGTVVGRCATSRPGGRSRGSRSLRVA
jgi:hypothetical protein